MATKILDLEIAQLPTCIDGLGAYTHALILFRYHGHPVGRVWAPVEKGALSIKKAIAAAGDWPLWERLLHDYLDYNDIPEQRTQPATIAICTRDRPEDVERCLQGLLALPGDGQEILVIDNCPSTEATGQIVQRYPDRVRYVQEAIPGLNHARNRALQEARYDIVAFTDDDTVPDPGWLRALTRNFSDPLVLCVTGLTMPLELETEAQEWFERYSPFNRGFTRKAYDLNNLHPLSPNRAGAGANMALRKETLQLVGAFDEALDAGTPTQSGGDTEMFSRILSQGYRIVYDPDALNWHRHRRSWDELRKAIYGYGVGTYAWLTQKLLFENEVYAPVIAVNWFLSDQLPSLVRSMARLPGSVPLSLILAEMRGCLAGPRAVFASRKKIQAFKGPLTQP